MANGMKWFWIAFALILAWLLWPFVFNSHVPAFRDGFHFYYPQAVWLDSCYSQGNYFPLWNPNEGFGSSVAGQPTWQLYYPLRAIWAVPILDVGQRYALFVAVHLLMAVIGLLRLGGRLGIAPAASCVGAMAYSLSCPVLFQLNNLIYLCSATWVAWGLIPVVRLVTEQSTTGSWNRLRFYMEIFGQIAVVGSLMTLAGDPHGAVNFAVVLFFAAVYRFWLASKSRLTCLASVEPNSSFSQLGLGILAVLMVCLASYQTAAALPWYRLSSRAATAVRVSDSFHPLVNEILHDVTLVQPQRVFDFSLSPWSLPTIVWPTWAGHFQPQHSRWVQAISSEGRMWIPSLYIGIIPTTLAVYAIRRKQDRSSVQKLLMGLCLVSTLLAMGNYSVVWLLRNILDGVGANQLVELLPTDAAGSLYGLLRDLIPGYGSFRYPAKWNIWIVACLSVLAACGVDQLVKIDFADSKFVRWMMGASGVSFLLWLAIVLCFEVESIQTRFASWIFDARDAMLGTPNATASIRAIELSFLHPAVVLATAGIMLWLIGAYSRHKVKHSSWLIVVILGLDIALVAQNWLVSVEAPVAVNQQPDAKADFKLVWANASRADVDMVSQLSSPDFREALQLQEKFLIGKLNHLYGYAALNASGSIEPQAVVVIKRWLQRNDDLQMTQPKLDEVLAALGVTQRLVRNELGQLAWKSVEKSGSLCEFFPDGNLKSDPCSHNWLSSDEIQIAVSAIRSGRILVRQMNDGGWQVSSSVQTSVQLVDGEFFIACSLAPGEHTITLRRKAQ